MSLGLPRAPKGIRQYSTGRQRESLDAVWNTLSVDDKLQSALVTDEPGNAEVAYYKGLAFKRFGTEYSGHALATFREALELCRPEDTTIKKQCREEIVRMEDRYKVSMVPQEQLTQLHLEIDSLKSQMHNEIEQLKTLILTMQRSFDQNVRKT